MPSFNGPHRTSSAYLSAAAPSLAATAIAAAATTATGSTTPTGTTTATTTRASPPIVQRPPGDIPVRGGRTAQARSMVGALRPHRWVDKPQNKHPSTLRRRAFSSPVVPHTVRPPDGGAEAAPARAAGPDAAPERPKRLRTPPRGCRSAYDPNLLVVQTLVPALIAALQQGLQQQQPQAVTFEGGSHPVPTTLPGPTLPALGSMGCPLPRLGQIWANLRCHSAGLRPTVEHDVSHHATCQVTMQIRPDLT